MPELKSLLLGLIGALGIFSIKSGCGLSYLLTTRPTRLGKLVTFVTVSLVYGALFLGAWYLCRTIDLVHFFNRLSGLFASGMVLHVLMAAGTMLWAVSLLKGNEDSPMRSYGWLALVVPCPVCASAILFITGFLTTFFPDRSFEAVAGAYAVYFVLSLLTVGLFALSSKLTRAAPERALGLAMLFVSGYFLLSILVAPHFAELERIYRIAGNKTKDSMIDVHGILIPGSILALTFAAGFAVNVIRRVTVHRDDKPSEPLMGDDYIRGRR